MIDNVTKEEKNVLLQKRINNLAKNPMLTLWEKEFLNSVSSQIRIRELSDKQLKIIDKINHKYTRKK